MNGRFVETWVDCEKGGNMKGCAGCKTWPSFLDFSHEVTAVPRRRRKPTETVTPKHHDPRSGESNTASPRRAAILPSLRSTRLEKEGERKLHDIVAGVRRRADGRLSRSGGRRMMSRPEMEGPEMNEPDAKHDLRPKPPLPDLALVRTDLANERTLLAYGRTALMLAGTGVSLIKFLKPSPEILLLGWFLVAVGLVVGVVGVVRFTRLKRRLKRSHEMPGG